MSPQRGFTLLELLVAMAIMSIIGASLYTSLHLAFKVRDSAEAAVEKVRALEIAMALMKEELASTLPVSGVLAGAFEGEDEEADGSDADTLSFYSGDNVPGEDDIACDVHLVEFWVAERDGSDEKVIVRGITTNLLSPKTLDPDEEILCGNIDALNFRYYDGSDWQDDWDSGDNDNALPEAVEISITLAEDEDADDDEEQYALTETIILPCGGGGDGEE